MAVVASEMLNYLVRVAPGIVVIAAFLVAVPRVWYALRITGYIFAFILIRDAMTPLGFWSFGIDGTFWIRFASRPGLLVVLGLGSLLMVGIMLGVEPGLRRLVRWKIGSLHSGVAMALVACAIIIAPLAIHYRFIPTALRGGAVEISLLLPLLAVTLFGNLYEEVLFRGFLQGHLIDRGVGAVRASLIAGTGFAAGHVFLASTVTSVGVPLLAFAWYEGLVLSFLRVRHGVLPAVLAHGLAVFLLTSGLL